MAPFRAHSIYGDKHYLPVSLKREGAKQCSKQKSDLSKVANLSPWSSVALIFKGTMLSTELSKVEGMDDKNITYIDGRVENTTGWTW